MFVRCKMRRKDGKEHRYWSVVENVRVRGGRVVQRQVLYLGEINDSQRAAWCRSIAVLDETASARQLALFPADRAAPALDCEVVQIRVTDVQVRDPRQWGACWLALTVWDRLELDRFWGPRLPPSRQGTRWLDVLKVQVCYRLIDPGSDWRLHRHWYAHSALRDLLGTDRVLTSDTLYRCLDKLVVHKRAFFSFLRTRWTTLFDARFDVLLYDLTSTYFESDPPFDDKRRFGYSRDKRSDCVQVVIALIVTPDGFPLAYEVMPGNTTDQTTLAGFLEQIEQQYGRSQRVWIMDRGIPTEATLAAMRAGDAPVRYLVGTPKGRLTRLEQAFLAQPWQAVRPAVTVKLLAEYTERHGDGQETGGATGVADVGGHGGPSDERWASLLRAAEPGPGGFRIRCVRRGVVRGLLRGPAGTAESASGSVFPDAVHRLFRGSVVGARDCVAGGGFAESAVVSGPGADRGGAGSTRRCRAPGGGST